MTDWLKGIFGIIFGTSLCALLFYLLGMAASFLLCLFIKRKNMEDTLLFKVPTLPSDVIVYTISSWFVVIIIIVAYSLEYLVNCKATMAIEKKIDDIFKFKNRGN